MGPINGTSMIPTRQEYRSRALKLAINLRTQKEGIMMEFNSKNPLTLMHMGIDIGTHNNLRRSMLFMGATKVNLNDVGWRYSIENIGFKAFEHCSISQFYGFLKGHKKNVTPQQLNTLLANIAHREAKEKRSKIKKQIQILQHKNENIHKIQQQQKKIKSLEATIGINFTIYLYKNLEIILYILCYIFYFFS